MSTFLNISAFSLLSFHLPNKMGIFMDGELDTYGFIRETSSYYYSLMGDMILWGLKGKYCMLIPLFTDSKRPG